MASPGDARILAQQAVRRKTRDELFRRAATCYNQGSTTEEAHRGSTQYQQNRQNG